MGQTSLFDQCIILKTAVTNLGSDSMSKTEDDNSSNIQENNQKKTKPLHVPAPVETMGCSRLVTGHRRHVGVRKKEWRWGLNSLAA